MPNTTEKPPTTVLRLVPDAATQPFKLIIWSIAYALPPLIVIIPGTTIWPQNLAADKF